MFVEKTLGVEALSTADVNEERFTEIGTRHEFSGVVDIGPDHLVVRDSGHESLKRPAGFGVLLHIAEEVVTVDLAVVVKGGNIERLTVVELGKKLCKVDATRPSMVEPR